MTLELAKLVFQVFVALATGYLALTVRAIRAEIRLEIRNAVDAALEKVAKEYVPEAVCELRHKES